MLRRTALSLLLSFAALPASVLALPVAIAQQSRCAEGSPEQAAAVATAIRVWVAEFEQGRLGAKGTLRRGTDLQPRYVAHAVRACRLSDDDEERITHLDALQKLLFFAEHNPSPDMTDAVLGVAAAGLESSFLDLAALELREVGHWTLARMDHHGSWFVILRAAAGEHVPVLSDLRAADTDEASVTVGPARRVAALHLLGRKNWPVFRSTLDGALGDPDPRVRLAAAEAMLPPWRVDRVHKVSIALGGERHPVVSQALVRLLLAMLRTPPPELGPAQTETILTSALQQFGRCGWRTDMDLLDLVEAFPHKAAVPTLIAALDLEVRSPDALITAVNKRASPLLRERAVGLLRAMTGALIAGDDLGGWRDFWHREQGNIVVPAQLKKDDPGATRAQFFGVPVTGGSIAFLIDTSGSMAESPGGAPSTGPRRRGGQTRLSAAKEQLLLAVQAMAPESQYYVFTFSDHGRAWTSTPIKADSRSVRSLTELLSRFGARGGTNLHDGLVQALQLGEHRYGEIGATKIDELFVLSDGQPTAGAVQGVDDLLEIVREANKYTKVRIHTVFTGAGPGSELLRRLAEENGGVHVQR
jgi:hypothetical protein